MTGGDEHNPPNLIGPDDWKSPGVDTGGKRFWFPSTDPNRYSWEVRGRYDVRDGKVIVTEIAVLLSDQFRVPTSGLNWDRIRRLTRLEPIKAAILRQIAADSVRLMELHADLEAKGRPLESVARWIDEHKDVRTPDAPTSRSHRYPDDEWAGWAIDYLDRVTESGTAYGVQKDIAEDEAWGRVSYETVRDRVKAMRHDGWVTGRGHLVEPGPRLMEYLADQRNADAAARQAREASG